MLQLGASKPWPEAMELVTGQPKMDAGALREYFAPLETWLKAENERTGETIGWDKTDKCKPGLIAGLHDIKNMSNFLDCVQTREELSRLSATVPVNPPRSASSEEN